MYTYQLFFPQMTHISPTNTILSLNNPIISLLSLSDNQNLKPSSNGTHFKLQKCEVFFKSVFETTKFYWFMPILFLVYLILSSLVKIKIKNADHDSCSLDQYLNLGPSKYEAKC
jgi:hypothetical protein